MSIQDSGQWLNYLMGSLLKKIVVPSDFHGQCSAVETMLLDDVSGLVDSLTDFSVETASVNFSIESENKSYARVLNKWLQDINKEFRGKIPTGIDALAKEYYKERWKGSSFPVLKMGGLKRYDNGLMLPTKMFFVDGSSINAKEKDNGDVRHLLNYNYYLGNKCEKKYLLDGDNVIFARPYGRWFDKYPVPYLIKRGIYHNWTLIDSIKNKQTEILEQIISYLMLVKKGSPELIKENIKAGYSDPELSKVKESIQTLMDKLNDVTTADGKIVKSPIRVTNFDEEIKHLIPDLENIFKAELTQSSERNILSGMGFIDIVEATSTSRKESVLNPKAFIEETKSGVKGFRDIMKQIMYYVEDTNKKRKKYINSDTYIINSPVKGFMTDNFKRQVKRLFDAGKVSAQTAVELIAEIDFTTEIMRKEKESKSGIDYTMYPPIIQNQEDKGLDFPTEKPVKKTDKNGNVIPEDKINPNEKKEYDIGSKINLEIAPYLRVKDLPTNVKKKLTPAQQKKWMKIFNHAYKYYLNKLKDIKKAETIAFRIAWEKIKQVKSKKK